MPITLAWQGLPYPPLWSASLLNGSNGAGAAGGQQLLPDYSGIVVWKNGGAAGQFTVYSKATNTWSAVGTYPATSTPSTWGKVSHGRICFMDTATYRIVSCQLGGAGYSIGGAGLASYESTLYPSHLGLGWLLHAPSTPRGGFVWFPGWGSDLMGFIGSENDAFGRSFIMGLSAAYGTPNWIVTVPEHLLGQDFAFVGSGPTPTGTIANSASIPGRVYSLTTGLYGGYIVPANGFADHIVTADATAFCLPNDGSAVSLARNYCAFADRVPLEKALSAIGRANTSGVAIGTGCYVQKVVGGGGNLAGVLHVPFNMQTQTIGAPLAVATPAPFSSANWSLFAIDNTAYILDDLGNFFRLTIAGYDVSLHQVLNWNRSTREGA